MYSDDRMRGGASARGYDARWREARALFLKQHPLCAFCQAEGKIVPTGNPSARNAMIRKPEAGCDACFRYGYKPFNFRISSLSFARQTYIFLGGFVFVVQAPDNLSQKNT